MDTVPKANAHCMRNMTKRDMANPLSATHLLAILHGEEENENYV